MTASATTPAFLDLDVGAGLIGVDLQEHVADARGRPLAMSDDNLDLFHTTIIARMHTEVTAFIASDSVGLRSPGRHSDAASSPPSERLIPP